MHMLEDGFRSWKGRWLRQLSSSRPSVFRQPVYNAVLEHINYECGNGRVRPPPLSNLWTYFTLQKRSVRVNSHPMIGWIATDWRHLITWKAIDVDNEIFGRFRHYLLLSTQNKRLQQSLIQRPSCWRLSVERALKVFKFNTVLFLWTL